MSEREPLGDQVTRWIEGADERRERHEDRLEMRRLREYAEGLESALRGLLTAATDARWPLTAEQMLPMNQARAALAKNTESTEARLKTPPSSVNDGERPSPHLAETQRDVRAHEPQAVGARQEEFRIGRSDFATTPDAVETEDLRQALERARGCIKGMLARTPVRDVAETLAEIDAALECHHAYSSKDAAIREAIEVFRGFRAGCSICDDEGRELDWRDIDRRCLVAMKALEAALEP